jgi:kynurenine formamidase
MHIDPPDAMSGPGDPRMPIRWVTLEHLEQATRACSNWGRWGEDDQIGTLNYITAATVADAAKLVRRGSVFPLSIPLDSRGPQEPNPLTSRYNPIHTMLATGTDVYAGIQPNSRDGCGYADDAIALPTQCSTQWDSLAHVFYKNRMYNGRDARLVDVSGAKQNGIEHTVGKMIGRGLLLDVARFKGVDCLDDGYGISSEELDACAKAQKVEVKRGDFLIFRTGQLEGRLARGTWDQYCGGDAPGLKFETCYWLHEKEVAAVCSDTWGCEVRPNETIEAFVQPWHAVVIPAMGLAMGEIFFLKDLAADCTADGIYEFFFTAPPLNITGGCGSPVTPLAIK